MVRSFVFVCLFVLVVPVIGCGEPKSSKEEDSHAQAEHAHGLTLNQGSQWEMDSHTRSIFEQMATSFREGNVESGEREVIKTTGKKIRGEINDLIRGCTMEGEAHDQLHKYLAAYVPAVDRMARSGTKADADGVGALLDLYPTYFR